jgi:hypothetical protein
MMILACPIQIHRLGQFRGEFNPAEADRMPSASNGLNKNVFWLYTATGDNL